MQQENQYPTPWNTTLENSNKASLRQQLHFALVFACFWFCLLVFVEAGTLPNYYYFVHAPPQLRSKIQAIDMSTNKKKYCHVFLRPRCNIKYSKPTPKQHPIVWGWLWKIDGCCVKKYMLIPQISWVRTVKTQKLYWVISKKLITIIISIVFIRSLCASCT